MITIQVFPEASKLQLFLCWHILDQVQGLFQPDLLVSSVPRFPHQLNTNIFLNPKSTHKGNSWLSGNEGKGLVGKPTETKPHKVNYVNQANRARVICWLWKTMQSSLQMVAAVRIAGARAEPGAVPTVACGNPAVVRLDTSRAQTVCCPRLERG